MECRVLGLGRGCFAALLACLLITNGFEAGAAFLPVTDAIEFIGGGDYGFVENQVPPVDALFSATENELWSSTQTELGRKVSLSISRDPGDASSNGSIHMQTLGGTTNDDWTEATVGWEFSNWTGEILSDVYILAWAPADGATGVHFGSPDLGFIDVAPNTFQPDGYTLGAIYIGNMPANSSLTTEVQVSYLIETGLFEWEMIDGVQTAILPSLTITAFSAVPEPSTALLFATGLLGLAIKGRRLR